MLADLFGRRQRPILKINYKIQNSHSTADTQLRIVIVGIKNEGRYLARFPAMRLRSTLRVSKYGIDGNGNWFMRPQIQDFHIERELGMYFAGDVNHVIHPSTFREVAVLEYDFPWPPTHELQYGERSFIIYYEIYAEGCEPVIGELVIPPSEMVPGFKLDD